jgi:hypothetical protein
MPTKRDTKINGFIILFIILLIGGLVFAGYYLWLVYQHEGVDRLIYGTVLVLASLIGLAHIFLFFARKMVEEDRSNIMKRKKRQLERIRNAVNYLTPIVLIAMLYHFWKSGDVLVCVVVTLLLLDRLNELRKSFN